MEKAQRFTALLVITAPLLVIMYDYIIYVSFGKGATITYVIRNWAEKYQELPYIVGGLFVWLWLHLFFEIVVKRV